ncbi:unnamed protein product [Phaedon cochleariae]|uniref:Zinc transporter ZIP11 n=1 Tax=Phaedon cochleariae TaxID=80249 RepID=A0A9N9SNE5_PHACE|nr:unnamed protein product [Phaedon cochleariae]
MIQGYGPVMQAFFGTLITWGLTAAGAALVIFIKGSQRRLLDASLGFAAGVMTAASFWSLLAPAIEQASESTLYGENGEYAFLPVAFGFLLGALFVFGADRLITKLGIHSPNMMLGTQKLVSSETGSVQVRPITPRKAEEQKEEEAIRVKSTKVKDSHGNKNDKINRDRTRTQNHVQTQQYIKPSDINSAIKSANEAAIMREILELGNNQPPSDESTKDGGNWETRRTKKRRRFIIGGNEENTGIEAVPKYSTLHVTRLKPDTKPEDLEKLLKERFPEVRCEQHASKRPDLYATVKVTIRKEHYREAWKKEVWPIGALVSNFFFPRRMPQVNA